MPDLRAVEVTDAQEAVFNTDDSGKMTADIAIIKAGRAKNPRRYRATALKKAAESGIYDGARMFVDHSDKPPIKRQFRELVSAVESTRWDPDLGPEGGVRGTVEFFNKEFFDQVQRSKKYVGVSVDQKNRVYFTKEGQQMIEDVVDVALVRSVDWVLFPSAGGEILSFARESEGEDQVEWTDITAETLKANNPQLYAAIQAEGKPAQESEDDDPKDEEKLTKDDVAKIVATAVQEAIQEVKSNETKRADTQKAVRDYVSKSGLPARTQNRIISQYSDALEYVEDDVKASVEDAKEELKELGVGPQIRGEGPSGTAGNGKPTTSNAREGVETVFGFPKASDKKKDD